MAARAVTAMQGLGRCESTGDCMGGLHSLLISSTSDNESSKPSMVAFEPVLTVIVQDASCIFLQLREAAWR